MDALTFEAVEAKIREIIAENPDHVYVYGDCIEGSSSRCYYSAGSIGAREACLFGQVFSQLGVADEVLMDHEGKAAVNIPLKWKLPLSERQLRWIDHLQSHQDNGTPWGKALRWVDAGFPLN